MMLLELYSFFCLSPTYDAVWTFVTSFLFPDSVLKMVLEHGMIAVFILTAACLHAALLLVTLGAGDDAERFASPQYHVMSHCSKCMIA